MFTKNKITTLYLEPEDLKFEFHGHIFVLIEME